MCEMSIFSTFRTHRLNSVSDVWHLSWLSNFVAGGLPRRIPWLLYIRTYRFKITVPKIHKLVIILMLKFSSTSPETRTKQS
jgi:hypothetical protein